MIVHNPYVSGTLELENPISGSLNDAPSDGTTYGRKDGAWIQVQASAASTIFAYTLQSINLLSLNIQTSGIEVI
jgi:hypothetical protein